MQRTGANVPLVLPVACAVMHIYKSTAPSAVSPRAQLVQLPRLLVEGSTQHLPQNREARRRLHQIAASLDMRMPQSCGVLGAGGLSVLIPHYAETIRTPMADLFDPEELEEAHSNARPHLENSTHASEASEPGSIIHDMVC